MGTKRLFALLSIAYVWFNIGPRFASAFVSSIERHGVARSRVTPVVRHCLSEDIIDAASVPLLWEEIENREAMPVLDLSNRDADMFASQRNNQGGESTDDNSKWRDGTQWTETRHRLQEMGVITSDEQAKALLRAVPQLLRIDTDVILDSASTVIDLLDSRCILREPRLLCFRKDDLLYGVEFLSTMMMAPSQSFVLTACLASPALLLSGAEGGLQERAVERALGAAGDATGYANKHIASDAAASLKAFQKRRKPPGL